MLASAPAFRRVAQLGPTRPAPATLQVNDGDTAATMIAEGVVPPYFQSAPYQLVHRAPDPTMQIPSQQGGVAPFFSAGVHVDDAVLRN